jgi:predicted peroxiredoxin
VKKLGILISSPPGHRNFQHGVELARTALARGLRVYLYCIDDAVNGIARDDIQSLKKQGVALYGCAYSARCRNVPIDDRAAYSGLTIVSDLLAATDKFVSF